MNEKKITFISKEEQKEVKGGGAPHCNCWWDRNSQCQVETGCITATWTSTSGK